MSIQNQISQTKDQHQSSQLERQHDYSPEDKRKNKILELETVNQTYRDKLFQLNETLDKLLRDTKGKSNKGKNKSLLESQLLTMKKDLQNKDKHIDYYKKQIRNNSQKEDASTGYDTLAESKFQIKQKQEQLNSLRRQVKIVQTTNKGIEQKLLQFSNKGKPKLLEEHIQMRHELLAENQMLKKKIARFSSSEKKKEEWLSQNKQNTSMLKKRMSLLPEIEKSRSRLDLKRRSVESLTKLSTEKEVYTRWLDVRKPRKPVKLNKQIEEAENINESLKMKIVASELEISRMQQKIKMLKPAVTPRKVQKAREILAMEQEVKANQKTTAINCDIRFRQERRDWVGRFTGLRFSDSRLIREQTRLYKITHNDVGYYQFHYYYSSNPQKRIISLLPFDVNLLAKGKETAFTAEYPDFIKGFRLKISATSNIIVGMLAFSNLGLTAEFHEQVLGSSIKVSPPKTKQKSVQPFYVPPQEFAEYTFNVKMNEAPTIMFGSYLPKYDQKKHLIKVSLQGLGVQLIQDYVEEII